MGNVFSIIGHFVADVSLDAIHKGQPNDFLVSVPSQQGGLEQNARTYFPETSHFVQTERENIVSEVDRLLELSPDEPDFDNQFEPTSLSISPQIAMISEKVSNSLQKNQIIQTDTNVVQIIYPPEGVHFLSGDEITVTAEGSGGASLAKILFLTKDTMTTDEDSPFEFHLKLPKDIIGAYTIGTLGKDKLGSVSYDNVNIYIGNNAGIDSLKVEPNSILLTDSAEVFPLSVHGFFADGISRDLTNSGTGTTYNSDNLSVVTVDNEGILTAVNDGVTTVIVNNNGVSNVVKITVKITDSTTSIPVDGLILPKGFYLFQNYPNPFNNSTTIKFNLPKSDNVTLCIYNIMGQLVRKIYDNQLLQAGSNEIVWDGLNEQGMQVSTGIYLYRFEMSDQVFSKKMIFMK